jgi:salicylate hydroxylase
VHKLENHEDKWISCPDCWGQGRQSRRLPKKARKQFQKLLDQYERLGQEGPALVRPLGHKHVCKTCNGCGLTRAENHLEVDKENLPHVAIVGGGIGGVALALACLHRGIPYTLYERDESFDARSQGYGLTLQQGSKAVEALGIFDFEKGLVSTRHVVHTTQGKVIGEWGCRNWSGLDESTRPKRRNIHIARQSLREALLDELGGAKKVEWNHQLVGFKENEKGKLDLSFKVNGKLKTTQADLLVGADGIRSWVRRLQVSEEASPLRYLGCIVILGICPLENLKGFENPLLDSATVFQTANGHERMYMMPFSEDSVMWQLSFPMSEDDAKDLSSLGVEALKAEAIKRCDWHMPIPEILEATDKSLISGYPAYDRIPLEPEILNKGKQVTLIGDAAHPMSPFKGQGANQALIDALNLARGISKGCKPFSNWREKGLRESVLNEFEEVMLERTAPKVIASAEAAEFLHSEVALYEGNEPRGRCLRREV